MQDYIVDINKPIIEVLKQIDKNAQGMVYVCDEERHLLGAITDGDIRRNIIKTGKLDAIAGDIMKKDPITLHLSERSRAEEVMRERVIRSIPIVDEDNKIIDICFFLDTDISNKHKKVKAPVVIMAGGKGMRLRPYTQILPKPLIPIGEKTITEHIIDRFTDAGCQKIDIIVNYKKHFIEAYFQDSDCKAEIQFIEENEYLGTGGGLRLLSNRYQEPFFMTNCDILIEDDYSEIMEYHKKNGNIATIVCAVKNMTLPYGVIETRDQGQVSRIKEKPDISAIVNTGFYVLNPSFIEEIPRDTFVHITDVLQKCIDKGLRVGMYPVSEDRWMDMGQMTGLEEMISRMEDKII